MGRRKRLSLVHCAILVLFGIVPSVVCFNNLAHSEGSKLHSIFNEKRVSDGIVFIAVSFGLSLINPSIALASTHIESQSFTTSNLVVSIPKQFPKGVLGPYADQQSPAWELARQKRTAAIKKMAEQGIIKVDTDDTGSQFLSLPWIPNQKIKYKSLSLQQQLLNEVCAGAFGEIFKDTILHGVDTYKTRSQQVSTKKKKTGDSTDDEDNDEIENKDNVDIRENPISSIAKQAKDLYAGFPVVATSSIPQGAAFFFAKKSVIEAIQSLNPAFGASFIGQTLPIIAASSVYWGIRTPAEVIKTQVQTGQQPNVRDAFRAAKNDNENGIRDLWKFYPPLIQLDIPFQILAFTLYGIANDFLITKMNIEPSIWTRLIAGVSCGMISAGITCPIDVAKTRIISREKMLMERRKVNLLRLESKQDVSPETGLLLSQNLLSTSGEFNSYEDPTRQSQDYLLIDEQVLESTISTNNIKSILEKENESALTSSAYDDMSTQQDFQEMEEEILSSNKDVIVEMRRIYETEGKEALFLGLLPRMIYVGLANGIRLAAYGTSRMDLMMRNLDEI